jgi:hypothetical protein
MGKGRVHDDEEGGWGGDDILKLNGDFIPHMTFSDVPPP